jgi:hypothetical protein
MTDEQKLTAAGFESDGGYYEQIYTISQEVCEDLHFHLSVTIKDGQVIKAEKCHSVVWGWVVEITTPLPDIKTVDDVLTLASLLGLSKEVE